jgi:ribosomal protein S6--L-glutamate ligase
MNILILATAKNSLAVKRLTYEAKKRGHSVLVIDPMDLYIYISDSVSGYDRVYYKNNGKVHKLNIKDIDAVLVRLGNFTAYGALLVEHFEQNLNIFCTNPAEGIRNATNQLKTLQKISSAGILTPRTTYTSNASHIDSIAKHIGSQKLVLKQLGGSGGAGISLIKDFRSAKSVMEGLHKAKVPYLLQEFLPAGSKDYRLIVVGDQTICAMERTARRGEFRANLKLNGRGIKYNPSDEEKELAVRACRAVGLYTGGVDLIKAHGRVYVSEINANPGWDIEKISNYNIALDVIKFCEQNYQKKIPEKNLIIDYQKQLAEVRSQNEELTKLVSRSNQQLRLLTGDKYLKDVYRKAKGNKISYKNRDNQTKVLKVEHMHDLFQIMKDSFLIK